MKWVKSRINDNEFNIEKFRAVKTKKKKKKAQE
jgi:hypothetical protein